MKMSKKHILKIVKSTVSRIRFIIVMSKNYSGWKRFWGFTLLGLFSFALIYFELNTLYFMPWIISFKFETQVFILCKNIFYLPNTHSIHPWNFKDNSTISQYDTFHIHQSNQLYSYNQSNSFSPTHLVLYRLNQLSASAILPNFMINLSSFFNTFDSLIRIWHWVFGTAKIQFFPLKS